MMNYFEWFGLKRSYDIDQKVLRSAYVQKSMSLHPDKTTDKSAAEIDTAYNNIAFTTLKNDHSRLEYILQLEGVVATDAKHDLPQEFLMEMLDLNIAIEEAKEANDSKQLDVIQNQLNQMDQNAFEVILPILKNYDNQSFTDIEKEALKKYYLIKRYLLRIGESITTFASH